MRFLGLHSVTLVADLATDLATFLATDRAAYQTRTSISLRIGATSCFSCPLCTCAGAVVLTCSQLQFSTRAPPSCVRAAPMAPNKQAVPMKGARHSALSAKTTIKKQAPRTVLRSIAAQAAGCTPGKQAGKAPWVTWIVVHAHLWLSLGIRGVWINIHRSSGGSGWFNEVADG